MKIRNGFVSNSSSCSFMIAGKDLDKKIFRQVIEVKISESKNISKIIKSEKELEEYIESEQYMDLNSFILYYCRGKENYERVLKALRSGEQIAIGDASDEPEDVLQGFVDGGLKDDPLNEIVVIADCEGY